MSFSPLVLGIIGTAAAVGGTIINTMANISAANYQAQIATRNAAIAKENAERAEFRAQVVQQDQDAKAAALLGAQLAEQGASGLSVNGGSQLLTRKSARELARRDSLNIRQAGDLEAYNYRVQSEDSAAAARFARQQASFSLLSGAFDVGSSLIGGAKSLIKPTATTFSGATVPNTVLY